jgi:type II secretory pathway component PulF
LKLKEDVMAAFEYNALTSGGRLMTGTVEAGSNEEAEQMLTEMQLTVNEISKARVKGPVKGIGRSEFLLFNQQLASITKAGIPLEKGLRELAEDVGSSSMRGLITDVASDLEAGISIETAIEKRQKHFPPLYAKILKAGVETGRLSEMLMSLNRHLEIGSRTRRIIFEAMCYPLVVLLLAGIIITAVFVLVIPSFTEVLTDMMGDRSYLPWLTQWFITMSQHVVEFWVGAGIFVIAFIVIWKLLDTTAGGKRFKEWWFLRLPLVGRIYHKGTLARMAEAMAMLVGAGCSMPECLRLSAGATGSEKMKLECELLASQVETGDGIMEAGIVCRLIPRLFLYSVQLGGQRNELQNNLYGLGQMYSEQTFCLQSRLQSILLPTMIIGVGGFVALMVLSMFMPMVSMVSVLS